MKTFRRLLPTGLLLFLGAAFAAAQTTPLEITFGYRFVDVTGNKDEYRSQINESEGFLLRNVTFSSSGLGQGGFVDHLRLDASELGVGPAGSLRFEAGRSGLYNLHFFWRKTDQFSALPDFANPFFPDVIPGQHTYDRVRNIYDAELEILPGRIITPILGYTRNVYSGPAKTTYTIGQDEFQLDDKLTATDQEYRVGLAFDAGVVLGRVMQGWREFRNQETAALTPGAGNGNSSGTVLGVPVNLTSLNRDNTSKTTTPTTSAIVTGRLGSRVKLTGSYQRASGDTNTNEAENSAGSLVSFELSRLFAGLSETASTRSQATFWTGGGRAEFVITDGVDLSAGYSRRHRWLDGFTLISDLYLNTTTFTGQDRRNLLVALNANTAMDRTDDVFDVAVNARGIGPFALRAGWTETTQEVTVTPDASEIVVPGNQGGNFGRRIDAFTAGGTYSYSGLTLGADFKRELANDPIVRTDFLNRNRYRLRLAWNYADLLHISANGTQTDSANDRPGIGYDSRVHEYGGDFEITPVKALSLRFSASKSDAHSKIPIRDPATFNTLTSEQRENGISLGGSIGLALPGVHLEGSYLNFTNKGSYPFVIDRARITGDVPVSATWAVLGEWLRDKYNDSVQNLGSLGRYDANRYGIYVRWSP